MKQLLGVIGVLIISLAILFVAGTKPVNKEEVKSMDTLNVNIGKQWDKLPEMKVDTAIEYFALIETSKGTMKAELFAKEVPQTVNNFVFLAREKFYDGVIFHRIIKDFMVQTGDPKGDGTGGPGYKFADEKVTREYKRGTLAMANSGPNTNGSQFFIMTQGNTTLPKDYTIFGQIDPADSNSLNTLDSIAATQVENNTVGEMSKPTAEVMIKTVLIEEK